MTNNKQITDIINELKLEVIESFSNYNVGHGMTRHFIAKVVHDNVFAFIKIPLVDELKLKIKAEASWSRFINSQPLASQRQIRCPQVIALTNDYLLSEWIDAPLLDDESGDTVSSHQIGKIIDILRLILDLPASEYGIAQKQSWSQDKIAESVSKLPDLMNDAGIISKSDLRRSIEIVEKHIDQTEPGLSHGDVGPWQVFESDSELVLFDGEHSSAGLPRLKDTANVFMRLYTKRRNTTGLGRILNTTQSHLSLSSEQFGAELLPVLTKWSIIGLIDAHKDANFGDITTHQDKARELFELCLAEDLKALKSI